MKNPTSIITIGVICLTLITAFPSTAEASANNVNGCQFFDDKLKKIRSKMRHGYSAKQGEKLKYQEKQIRRIWWLCVNNKMTKAEQKKWRYKISNMTKS
ncbi:hypothetical protein QWY77_04395 [Thalassotalea ponticola]|uniref:hypothetical protein n=1 Tax=Thalassotalea ponticola TaxID=1523392 RepID=UPI0025B58738|nr:hypothetical protein [Thalassotalea ponticola]MDN3652006.1 hypothetical protein [Thalassotalea ponticola]